MLALIRSKGFLWLSNSHSQIFYWALAGKHFELKQYGMWWASVAEEEWPLDEKERQEIRKDFDASADGLGDRRQEVVFIGVKMDKAAITALLDACLIDDARLCGPCPRGDYEASRRLRGDPARQRARRYY